MYKKHGSSTPKVKNLLLLTLLLLGAPLWGQHGAHTHGKAELNLILNSDREMVAELITPAESVYGFEHAPRNVKEKEQMSEGLKRLKASLANMLTFEKKINIVTEIAEEKEHTEKSHAHHGHKHEDAEESHHRNVMLRWSIQCDANLIGQKVIVNWREALPDIHHMDVTLLTSDRQEAISLRSSGAKIRL